MILKKSSLLPISLLLAVIGIILACIDFGPSYPASFFTPETVHNDSLLPFFYPANAEDGLYRDTYKEDYNSDFYYKNLHEWSGYLGSVMDKIDLASLLYKLSAGQIDTLLSFRKNYKDFLKNAYVYGSKNEQIVKSFLTYLSYAKHCEPIATYIPGWYYDIKRGRYEKTATLRIKSTMDSLENEGLKKIANEKSDFIRQRYVFQVLRLYFLANDSEKCIHFYEKNEQIIHSIHNSIRYRCMGYLAGAYHKEKNFAEADYYYSAIYGEYAPMRISAFFSFHPQEETDWNQTLSMAKNTREKINMWELLGMYKDPLRAMKAIYALDPASDALNLLLVRSVNKEESNFINYNTYETSDSISIDSGKVNKELVDFVKDVANKENTEKPYMWNLAAAYLQWAKYNSDFNNYLIKAQAEAGTDTLVQDQTRLINILSAVESVRLPDKNFELKIAPELHWLLYAKHGKHFRKEAANAWLWSTLANKYARIGDTALYYCFNEPLFYRPKANDTILLKSIMNMFNKPDKSPMEVFASTEFNDLRNNVYDLQVVNLLYQHRFKDVINMVKNKGVEYRMSNADPFVIHIKDCHDCDIDDSTKKIYSTQHFAERMIKLTEDVKRGGSDVAEDYFLLGNAYYNMTYYGNSRVLYNSDLREGQFYFSEHETTDYFRRKNEPHNNWENAPNHNWKEAEEMQTEASYPEFYDCAAAENCYVKAMELSTDREFKAKCCFMAAKCEHNAFLNSKNVSDKVNFRAGKYFHLLKNEYSNTNYYNDAIKECGYFRTFAKMGGN